MAQLTPMFKTCVTRDMCSLNNNNVYSYLNKPLFIYILLAGFMLECTNNLIVKAQQRVRINSKIPFQKLHKATDVHKSARISLFSHTSDISQISDSS